MGTEIVVHLYNGILLIKKKKGNGLLTHNNFEIQWISKAVSEERQSRRVHNIWFHSNAVKIYKHSDRKRYQWLPGTEESMIKEQHSGVFWADAHCGSGCPNLHTG